MTRLRFTLRELFLAVIVFALSAAWYADHRRLNRERNQLIDESKQLRAIPTLRHMPRFPPIS
jgi:hypothetical protein